VTLVAYVLVDRPHIGSVAGTASLALVDRLGEQIIRELLRDSRTGTTHRALAEHYGISLSSVKRVLRRHRR
jgi:DNA-binding Lrp family transcriptional regulator